MNTLNLKLKTFKIKPSNLVAKDLLTAKYHMRVVKSKKAYSRKNNNKEMAYETSGI